MLNSGWSDFLARDASETQACAQQWAQQLKKNDIILLEGELGAGKTTFMKGLARGLGVASIDSVQSPTFTYLHIYEGNPLTVYHFDLYRLSGPEDFIQLGFEEFLEQGGVCCIEWPSRITPLLPASYWVVNLQHVDIETRKIKIGHYG